MINIDFIKNLSDEELEKLSKIIKNELKERYQDKNEFVFNFEATNDPRKGVPYVAKLFIDDDKLQRQFFDLEKVYGKKEVTISGKYTAKPGDIIEIRTGGSWKNDHRAWYYITENKEQIKVADINDSYAKLQVKKYLKGEMSINDLLK